MKKFCINFCIFMSLFLSVITFSNSSDNSNNIDDDEYIKTAIQLLPESQEVARFLIKEFEGINDNAVLDVELEALRTIGIKTNSLSNNINYFLDIYLIRPNDDDIYLAILTQRLTHNSIINKICIFNKELAKTRGVPYIKHLMKENNLNLIEENNLNETK